MRERKTPAGETADPSVVGAPMAMAPVKAGLLGVVAAGLLWAVFDSSLVLYFALVYAVGTVVGAAVSRDPWWSAGVHAFSALVSAGALVAVESLLS